MKKLIFIDDNPNILQKQLHEITEIFTDDGVGDVDIVNCLCDLSGDPTCFNDDGTLRDNNVLQETLSCINLVMHTVQAAITADMEKIELVIDLFLDDKDETLGFKLVKYILRSAEPREWFRNGKLVITMTSSYKSADYSNLKERFFDSLVDRDRIVECYRPIDPATNEFIKDSAAFPIFYYSFHTENDTSHPSINKLLLDVIHVSNNKGTYYGNYFGLIYARLFHI